MACVTTNQNRHLIGSRGLRGALRAMLLSVFLCLVCLLLPVAVCSCNRSDHRYGVKNSQAHGYVRVLARQAEVNLLQKGQLLGYAGTAGVIRIGENLYRLLDPSYDVGGSNTTGSLGYLDCWENEYCLSWDHGNTNETRVGEQTIPSRVCIWSCGADGVNDWGRNDDIVSWESYRMCMRRVERAVQRRRLEAHESGVRP